ncbi:hypothetical protein ACWDFL_38440 [Streptomyces bungoensis]
MSSTQPDVDRVARAYREPSASPLWHRYGPKARPLTPVQQRCNREFLELAQRSPGAASLARPSP